MASPIGIVDPDGGPCYDRRHTVKKTWDVRSSGSAEAAKELNEPIQTATMDEVDNIGEAS